MKHWSTFPTYLSNYKQLLLRMQIRQGLFTHCHTLSNPQNCIHLQDFITRPSSISYFILKVISIHVYINVDFTCNCCFFLARKQLNPMTIKQLLNNYYIRYHFHGAGFVVMGFGFLLIIFRPLCSRSSWLFGDILIF